jgi:hypothetical protein
MDPVTGTGMRYALAREDSPTHRYGSLTPAIEAF